MNVKVIVSAVAGLITGSAITYIFTRSHYVKKMRDNEMEVRKSIVEASNKLIDQKKQVSDSNDILEKTETESVKVESAPNTLEIHQPDTAKEMFTQRDIEEYVDYTTGLYDGSDKPRTITDLVKEKDVNKVITGPYPISPEEYGERTDYDQEVFIYYTDGVLADEDGDVIDSYKLSNTVGEDFKNAFGEYADDSAWFRNDDTKHEYLIEKSLDPYWGS